MRCAAARADSVRLRRWGKSIFFTATSASVRHFCCNPKAPRRAANGVALNRPEVTANEFLRRTRHIFTPFFHVLGAADHGHDEYNPVRSGWQRDCESPDAVVQTYAAESVPEFPERLQAFHNEGDLFLLLSQ